MFDVKIVHIVQRMYKARKYGEYYTNQARNGVNTFRKLLPDIFIIAGIQAIHKYSYKQID